MTRDMTSGLPLKLITAFCIPLIFGTLFQQFYSMVDSIVVGKFVGVDALAGVGSTGAINFLILGFANGLCSGFSILYGQRFGAKDYTGMRGFIANGIYLSIGIAVILRSIGDSKTPVYALVASAIINIVLDLLFVAVFHMGVPGVAIATVIAQGVSGGVCFYYMFKKYDVLRFSREELRRDVSKMRHLLGVGLPMALQFSITAVGSVILQSAANGLGAAMATYSSQNMGARHYERIKKGISIAIIIEIILSLAGFVLLNLFGQQLALLFVDASQTQVIRLIRIFLKVTTSSYILLGVLYVLHNSIQGMGYGILPMCAGIFELMGRIFAAFILVDHFGFVGVTLANPAAWLAADILLVSVYIYIRRTALAPHKEQR